MLVPYATCTDVVAALGSLVLDKRLPRAHTLYSEGLWLSQLSSVGVISGRLVWLGCFAPQVSMPFQHVPQAQNPDCLGRHGPPHLDDAATQEVHGAGRHHLKTQHNNLGVGQLNYV